MGPVKRRRPRGVAERPPSAYGAARLLLDTHALLWWFTDSPRLSRPARRAIGDASATVFVSAASAWEVATKVRLGKLHDPLGLADALSVHVAAQGFQDLPITLEHGRRAGKLPGSHKDPFDRMLVAQAQTDGLAIVSNEAQFDAYGIQRVW